MATLANTSWARFALLVVLSLTSLNFAVTTGRKVCQVKS
jgi:hypothetical protein